MKRLVLPIALGAGVLLLAVWWFKKSAPARPVAPPPSPEILYSSGTIGAGGSLSDSLAEAQVPAQESSQIERSLKPLFNPRYSKPSDIYEVFRSSSGRFMKLQYWPNSFEYYTVQRSSQGVFMPSQTKLSFEESRVGVSGQIHSSLWDAMIQQGVPAEMIYRFAELFAWRIDFLTEPRQGDTYKFVWKRRRAGQAFQDGEIVAACYNSSEKGEVCGYRLAGEYFDTDGVSLRGEFLRAPLAYRRISSRFTEHRFHPILRYYRPHHGIDYSAARGTPAVSIGEGVVISKGYSGGLGNEIRIRHAGSYVSIYGHLMGFARGLHVGSSVHQGQVVGYVGSTGLSTGPHLHFGFERAGQLINFLSLKFKNTRKTIPPAEKQHYEQIKQEATALFAQIPAGSALNVIPTPENNKK